MSGISAGDARGHRGRRSPSWACLYVALLGSFAGANRAHADELRCPLDGGVLGPPASSWNLAGGVDADGCGWSLDAEGRRRATSPQAVVGCGGCGAAFRRDLVPAALSPAEVAAVRSAAASVGPRASAEQRRCEVAAAVARALDPPQAAALAGELLLRAAHAARAHALADGPDEGYAPRDLAEAREQLAALAARATRRARDAEPVRTIDAALAELEAARVARSSAAADPGEPAGSVGARLRASRAAAELAALERRLLEERAVALEAARAREPATREELRLALLRARLRWGDPTGRAEEVAALRAQAPALNALLDRFVAGCTEEARLLAAAGAALRAAAEESADPAERARLALLAAECARRRGARDEARALLALAAAAAPGSADVEQARALLGP